MFKYSSTHVLNPLSLANVKAYKVDGTAADSYIATNYLLVDRDNKFEASAITSVRKAVSVESAVESVKFTMPAASEDGINCRVYIYLRTADQADPLFANDWIYKGKPFQIEFKGSKTAATSASNFVANVAKWINFTYGNRVIEASVGTDEGKESEVTLSIADGNVDLRFYKILVQEFSLSSTDYYFYADGGFETTASWVKGNPNSDNTLTVTTVTAGNSGFGTSMWLLKNLRLPTNANTRFYNFQADEMPVAGGKYNQYIITQCTERPEMQGTSVVGQYNKSVTTHILWVYDDGVSGATGSVGKFEAALTSVLPSATFDVEEGKTTVDVYTKA